MKDLRNDITDALIHLTKEREGDLIQESKRNKENKEKYSSLDVLCQILESGKLIGSTNTGFIKGKTPATCFTESPLSAVKHFASEDDDKEADKKFRFYGIALSKQSGFKVGARPVIYLPDDEGKWIPEEEKWRHVKYELGKVDWTHEREWRMPGDLELEELNGFYIIHWCHTEREQIKESLHKSIENHVIGYFAMKDLNRML